MTNILSTLLLGCFGLFFCFGSSKPHVKNKRTKKKKNNRSKGEEEVANYLQINKIKFVEQFVLDCLPKLRFDFMFEYNGYKYIVEFDGIQHFRVDGYYVKDAKTLKFRKRLDALKTQVAIQQGYRVIHIDYSKDITICMQEALKMRGKIYLSSEYLYGYLSEGVPKYIWKEYYVE